MLFHSLHLPSYMERPERQKSRAQQRPFRIGLRIHVVETFFPHGCVLAFTHLANKFRAPKSYRKEVAMSLVEGRSRRFQILNLFQSFTSRDVSEGFGQQHVHNNQQLNGSHEKAAQPLLKLHAPWSSFADVMMVPTLCSSKRPPYSAANKASTIAPQDSAADP